MLIKEKTDQAVALLNEFDVDCWLTFVRESSIIHDPAIDMIVGSDVTWQSAFIIGKNREKIAIVGSIDKTAIDEIGVYDEVIGYVEGMKSEKIMGYMIPEGALLSIDNLKSISQMDAEEALNEIKKALKNDLRDVSTEGGAHRIALELDRYLMRTSEKLSHIYPLSVLPVIDFIIRKKKEVDFIRIIVKGKDNGLSEGMIKELLVL